MQNNAVIATTKPILWIGFFIGLIISWGLLTGDHQGRVNILHLIAVYIFVPILSLVISSISLMFTKGINLANLVSSIPFWSSQLRGNFLKQHQKSASKLTFFYQSQLAAISFSFASLLIFFVLLLTTDVNFIWRSTLLQAEDLFPLLNFLATPWSFWESAQPQMELLLQTKDSRLNNANTSFGHLGDWWEFILAAQLFYALSLRVITISICKLFILAKANPESELQLMTERHSQFKPSDPELLARIVDDVSSEFALTNWAGINSSLKSKVLSQLSHQATTELKAGPRASYSEQLVSERWQQPQLVITKGWEPPLGELQDYLHNGVGYLLPLEWENEELKVLSAKHLNEWRRFAKSLPQWQVLQVEI